MSNYDLITIGGGSGGIATARRAAQYGAKVLLIEGGVIGGTCVNVGCVPKKVMWNAAAIREAYDLGSGYGFGTHALPSPIACDYGRLKSGRDAYIARLNAVYDRNLATAQIDRLQGWASFVDANTVAVGEHRVRAKHILIATGGHPIRPQIPGHELLATSDDFFTWEQLPPRVVIVGSGYIAVELAGMLRTLGSEVHVCVRTERILRSFDGEIAARLLAHMREQGIHVHTNTALTAVHQGPDARLTATLANGEQLAGVDRVLVAIGRAPNTALQLERAGVQLTSSGHIAVDAYQNTSTAGIYAIGDVTGQVELTPVAIAAGRQLAARLFNGKPEAKLDYTNIASVVFSHPPIGTVGMTEEAAVASLGADQVAVHRSNFINMLYALGDDKPKTLMKIVTRRADDRVLGMHVLGTGADEMIQGFAVAVKMGARKADLDATVAIHPTAAEEFVTM